MKHIFALRMAEPEYMGGRPIRDLFLYETENQVLTIEDFIEINSKEYILVCYFYGGLMTVNDFRDKYKIPFRMDLITSSPACQGTY